MNENFLTELYRKLIEQNINYEKSMDTTRNLSVFIIAGMMYFIFGFPQTSSHLIAILGSVTVFVLQIFESVANGKNLDVERKIKIIESNFFQTTNVDSNKLKQDFDNTPKLISNFVFNFSATTFKNYILIFLTLDICWFSKLYLFPTAASSWSEFFNRPAFGFLPGWFFYAFAGLFWITYFSLAIWYKITLNKHANEF